MKNFQDKKEQWFEEISKVPVEALYKISQRKVGELDSEVQHLEHKVDEINKINTNLMLEVARLKKEISKLQTQNSNNEVVKQMKKKNTKLSKTLQEVRSHRNELMSKLSKYE